MADNPIYTWQVTYTDAQDQLITEFIEANSVADHGQHVTFFRNYQVVFKIDQRAMHSARNVTLMDMAPNTTAETTDVAESGD